MSKDVATRIKMVPHWRVVIRPDSYAEDRTSDLELCKRYVEQSQVRFRGWPYPYVNRRAGGSGSGESWVASWIDMNGGHREYWRHYFSGQFIHLFEIREASNKDWHEKLKSDTAGHLSFERDVEWDKVPGFISINNLLFTITEIFEFVTRLTQKWQFQGEVSIDIQLNQIQGFVLTTDPFRNWDSYYAAAENRLAKSWVLPIADLLSETSKHTLDATVWFLQRFGWLNPNMNALQKDHELFIQRRS